MALLFKDCDVLINGSGILTDSISVSQANDIFSVPTIGYTTSSYGKTGPIKSSIQISYALQYAYEPFLPLIVSLRNGGEGFRHFELEFAGLRTNAYLDSFSFKVEPNSIIKASANFTSFGVFLGGLYEKYGVAKYNTDMNSFYNGACLNLLGSLASFKIYSFSYDCNLKNIYQPAFGGSTEQRNTPVPIHIGGEEKIVIQQDTWRNVSSYGEDLENLISSLRLFSLNFLFGQEDESVDLSFKNCKIQSCEFQLGLDGMLLPNFTIINRF